MRRILVLLLIAPVGVAGCDGAPDPLAVAGTEAVTYAPPHDDRYLPRDEVPWVYGYFPGSEPAVWKTTPRGTVPVPVPVGTRVRIIADADPSVPAADPGRRIATRALEGEHAGEVVLFPRKNLRPVPAR